MINEPLMQELRAITDYLDSIDPQWRKKIGTGQTGTMTLSITTSDSMTPPYAHHADVEGWVMPKDAPVNVRSAPRVAPSTYLYQITSPAMVKGSKKGDDGFTWYRISNSPDSYVRADVVIFSKDKPSEPYRITWGSDPAPITPINAALWPSPVTGYTITNTHKNHRDHDGYDYSCAYGTPIQAGPNGGFVAKAFTCQFCNAKEGDGKASLQDPGKAFGYGSHIIVRYAYDSLPQAVKTAIPNGAYVFAVYAHLSKVLVSQGQTLEPYQIIGHVGASGNTYGINGGDPSHLHLSLRWSTHPEASWAGMSNNRIDPKLLVKA